MAELEGRSVIFFVVLLRLGMIEAGSNVDCRVISYAWNWVLGGQPLIGRNRVLEKGCALLNLYKCNITMCKTDFLSQITIAHYCLSLYKNADSSFGRSITLEAYDVCRIGLLEVGVYWKMEVGSWKVGVRMLRVRNSSVIIGIPHKKLSVFDKPMIRMRVFNNLP